MGVRIRLERKEVENGLVIDRGIVEHHHDVTLSDLHLNDELVLICHENAPLVPKVQFFGTKCLQILGSPWKLAESQFLSFELNMLFKGDMVELLDVGFVVSVLQGPAFHFLFLGIDESLRRHIVEVLAVSILVYWDQMEAVFTTADHKQSVRILLSVILNSEENKLGI